MVKTIPQRVKRIISEHHNQNERQKYQKIRKDKMKYFFIIIHNYYLLIFTHYVNQFLI